MLDWLKRCIYVTEARFGFPDYRKPIPWFDKLLIVCELAAGVAGRLAAGAWLPRRSRLCHLSIDPTVNVYSGPMLLDVAGALEPLPHLAPSEVPRVAEA